MDEGNGADAAFRRNLILASALFHARPPADRVYANCHRVLRHALIAAGLWDEHLEEGESAAFTGDDEGFPVIRLWYSTLIDLTRHEPESNRLLNGAGNLVTPAGAFFTACWLTPAGKVVAEQLVAEHPQWRSKLTIER